MDEGILVIGWILLALCFISFIILGGEEAPMEKRIRW